VRGIVLALAVVLAGCTTTTTTRGGSSVTQSTSHHSCTVSGCAALSTARNFSSAADRHHSCTVSGCAKWVGIVGRAVSFR
jgi:hypothetical protein